MSKTTELTSTEALIKQRLAMVTKTTAAPASRKISTTNSVFTLPDGQKSPGPLNCIVVDYINANSYYDKPYNANDIQPPVCFAVGRELNSLAPSDEVENPVNDSCKTCPNNEFGSKGRGKACSNNVFLALLPENFDAESDLFTIKISPTGLTAWSTYIRNLAAEGKDTSHVITSIAFKEGVTYPTLTFKSVGPNPAFEAAMGYVTSADTILKGIGSAAA